MTFLDCPASLSEDGSARCSLPAHVASRYTMRSTDGPIECATIRCPAGHWFNGPIESLTRTRGNNHDLGTAAQAATSARDSAQPSRDRRDSGTGFASLEIPGWPQPLVRRPNTAPAYYLGRPAEVWINALRPRRRRTGKTPPDVQNSTALPGPGLSRSPAQDHRGRKALPSPTSRSADIDAEHCETFWPVNSGRPSKDLS
jgi:hypothetical protein